MPQLVTEIARLLRDGLGFVVGLVEWAWGWAAAQLAQLLSVPWSVWPLWRQLLLVVVIAAVAAALFRAVSDLLAAGGRILAGLALLAGAFVRTVPSVLLAGVIALGGLWLLNNFDGSRLALPKAADLSRTTR